MSNDPKITIAAALSECGSVQALAQRVGYSRAMVYRWQEEGRRYLPALAAYRYVQSAVSEN